MYQKVLLAVDGSDESKAAARAVTGLIDQGMVKQVIVLNVAADFTGSTLETHPTEELAVRIPSTLVEDINKIAIDNGQQILSEIRIDLPNDKNIEIIEKVVLGDSANTICMEAETNNCDLIVIGSQGKNKNTFRGLFLGSVSTRVLQFATCPVLVIKS